MKLRDRSKYQVPICRQQMTHDFRVCALCKFPYVVLPHAFSQIVNHSLVQHVLHSLLTVLADLRPCMRMANLLRATHLPVDLASCQFRCTVQPDQWGVANLCGSNKSFQWAILLFLKVRHCQAGCSDELVFPESFLVRLACPR
jgi:hypothetical protein